MSPRTNRSAKAAGTRFERSIADSLAEHVDDRIDRRAAERLASKVTITLDACWIWTGCTQPNGYGSIYFRGRTVRVHRLAYLLAKGDPGELDIDHTCGRRACFNPDHLEAVTHAENMRRIRRTACLNGHPYDDANTYVSKGKRYCRSCRRDRIREARRAA